MSKNYIEYYPNRIANEYKFQKHLKNEKRFREFCRGKEVPYYKDEGNWGTRLDMGDVSEEVAIKRAFSLSEFRVWKDWKEHGRNIFDFSENLLDLLAETDVLDLDISLIKLPFDGFYIDLSSAKIPFEVDNNDNFVEGVYVHQEFGDKEDFERLIVFDFTGNYINKYWKINVDLDWDMDRGFHSYSLVLDRNDNLETIKQSINLQKNGFVGEAVYDDRDENTKIELYKIHSQFVDRTINLVINCLFYLTTKEKDIEQEYTNDFPERFKQKLKQANTKRRKEKVNKEIQNNGFTKINYVGRTFKKLTHQIETGGETSTHWRRGHWRNQKYGQNLSENKVIWIMPTLVNKLKGEETKGHIYNVNG